MIDWLRWLGILPIELFFPPDGEGAFVYPMAFILFVEIAKWDFLSSTPIVSLTLVDSFFTMVTVIAAGSFIMMVPLAFSPVMVSGVSRFFFGNVVHCFLMLRLISVTWF